MKLSRFFYLLVLIAGCVTFVSCNDATTADITQNIDFEINSLVEDDGALRAGDDFHKFAGQAVIKISNYSAFAKYNVSAVEVQSITIKTTCTETGEYSVRNIKIESPQVTSGSVTIGEYKLGTEISPNELLPFAKNMMNAFIGGSDITVKVEGETNVASGQELKHEIKIRAKFSVTAINL